MFHCISNAFIIFHWVSILGFNHDHGSAAELEWVGSHFGDSGEVGHATCPYLSVVFPCRFGLLSHVGTICVSACSCCLWCIRHSASAGRWHYLQRAWAFVSRFAVSETMWDRIPRNILKPRECFTWIAMNMGKYWNYMYIYWKLIGNSWNTFCIFFQCFRDTASCLGVIRGYESDFLIF